MLAVVTEKHGDSFCSDNASVRSRRRRVHENEIQENLLKLVSSPTQKLHIKGKENARS